MRATNRPQMLHAGEKIFVTDGERNRVPFLARITGAVNRRNGWPKQALCSRIGSHQRRHLLRTLPTNIRRDLHAVPAIQGRIQIFCQNTHRFTDSGFLQCVTIANQTGLGTHDCTAFDLLEMILAQSCARLSQINDHIGIANGWCGFNRALGLHQREMMNLVLM